MLKSKVAAVLMALTPLCAGAAEQAPKAAYRQPDIAAQRAAIAKLDFMVGEWTGEGSIVTPNGRFDFRQTEAIRPNLDGAILLIDGRGYARAAPAAAAPAFSAFAVISFDEVNSAYAFRSYSSGHYGDFSARFLDDGAFEWNAPTMRYVVRIDDKGRWVETGERRDENGEWTHFFDMTLMRLD
jgi:hypothetical protein